MTLALWSLKHAAAAGLDLDKLPEPPRPGLTSQRRQMRNCPEAFYRAFGYHVCGPRAVRIDMLERLADLIRPLLAWRANRDPEATPPKGSTGDGGFTATPEMMSILGCSPEELGKVLKALGFRLDRRPIKVPATQPIAAASSTEQVSEDTSADVTVTAEAPAETASVVEPVAEAASGETASAAEPVVSAEPSAAPAEVQYEEIWRPRRHHRESHDHRGEGRNDNRGEGRTTIAAQVATTIAAASAGRAILIRTLQRPPRLPQVTLHHPPLPPKARAAHPPTSSSPARIANAIAGATIAATAIRASATIDLAAIALRTRGSSATMAGQIVEIVEIAAIAVTAAATTSAISRAPSPPRPRATRRVRRRIRPSHLCSPCAHNSNRRVATRAENG